MMVFKYTKVPNACQGARMAFMLEAENFNPWLEGAQGYLTHLLNAYDKNPVWDADKKRAPFREAAKRTLPIVAGLRHARREGGYRRGRLHHRRHVRELSASVARTSRAPWRRPSARRDASIADSPGDNPQIPGEGSRSMAGRAQ